MSRWVCLHCGATRYPGGTLWHRCESFGGRLVNLIPERASAGPTSHEQELNTARRADEDTEAP